MPSVAGAGDINSDGYADILVGSEFLSPNGTYSGGAYLVYGSADPDSVDLGSPGAWGFAIEGGAAVDFAGAVAGAGDVNHDGFDDVIVGARGADDNGDGAGASYVVYGRSTGHTVDLGSLAAADGFRIDGAAPSDNSGYSVAGAGDVNADGFDDVIVSSHNASPHAMSQAGSAHLVYGAAAHSVVTLSDPGPAAVRIDGTAPGDMAGWSVAGVGDMNRDQRPDVAIGARFADPSGRQRAGAAYVVYGGLAASQLDLASLSASGVRIDGAAAKDETGTSVAGAGDVNGDGSSDILVGAPFADPGDRFDAGSAYLILGDPKPADPSPPPVVACGHPQGQGPLGEEGRPPDRQDGTRAPSPSRPGPESPHHRRDQAREDPQARNRDQDRDHLAGTDPESPEGEDRRTHPGHRTGRDTGDLDPDLADPLKSSSGFAGRRARHFSGSFATVAPLSLPRRDCCTVVGFWTPETSNRATLAETT